MAKTYKLVVKRLPRKVCVSIRSAKGRTLTKRKYVKRYRKKSRRAGKRKRKMQWKTFVRQCMRSHKNFKGRGGGSKMKMCGRRYRKGLRP